MEWNGALRTKGFALFLTMILLSCSGDQASEDKEKSKPQSEQPKSRLVRPSFNADSAYFFIEKQVGFGPRVPNTESHRKAGNFLVEKLNSYGFEVTEQKTEVTAYDGQKLQIRNIIGEYKKELNNRIMLFAHWDSRPFADQDSEDRDQPIDGANDGGSGVGVLLEIARQIKLKQPTIGVDIFFFDAEDYGQPSEDLRKRKSGTWCLGSQYWAKNPHRSNYTANFGILLDMVGAKNAYFTKEAISMYYAPQIVNKVWNIASTLGHGNHFVFQETTHVGEDDHLYINKIAKIPSIDIIQYDPSTQAFAPHWHTHDDNMSIIDKNTLKAVGETVLATILQETN